jgi:translocator protein
MKLSKTFKLIISLFLPVIIGSVSSMLSMSSTSVWYDVINKPSFTPPDWLFAPAWTGLYILMGFAFYEIWLDKKSDKPIKRKAVLLFISQLVLNGLWSIIFFGFHQPLFAFIELIILLIVVLLTTYQFYKIFKPTFWLLLPYILWLLYAGALNLGIVLLN